MVVNSLMSVNIRADEYDLFLLIAEGLIALSMILGIFGLIFWAKWRKIRKLEEN